VGLVIGIDIGGTFTDVVALDEKGVVATFAKVPSTPQNPENAVLIGVDKILKQSGAHVDELDRVVHSSTISLNAIIERKGARLGILCTQGFRDLLIIGRQKRTPMYDLFLDAETPLFLCPRERILGVPERLDSAGQVVASLNEEAVLNAAKALVDGGVTAIAVCYLFSYLNPGHEQRTRDLIATHYPGVSVSISSEVDPQMREYERLVMTAFDAYLKPVVDSYLATLAGGLTQRSHRATLQIMQSRGGIMGWRQAAAQPIAIALSGPAAGVIGARHAAQELGCEDAITVDIGGTSCDIAVVKSGKPLIASEGKLDRYPVRQQMIDVNCIGAGGGSIAWVDEGGGLRVGPQSAGAFPGPACYGRGGREPTITDASVILGYLNTEEFGFGEISLSPQLAEQALRSVGEKIGLEPHELALGMHKILNSMMVDAIRLASVHRGFHPQQFSLIGLGGGGPVHVAALAGSLGCKQALVPPLPGVLCANGLLAANIEHDQSRTFLRTFDSVQPDELESHFAALFDVCTLRMKADGVAPETCVKLRKLDARYASQSYDLQIDIPEGPITRQMLDGIVDRFHDEHERIYGHAQRKQAVTIVTLRAVLSHKLANPKFVGAFSKGTLEDATKGERGALFDLDKGYQTTPVYDRDKVPAGCKITGPAILEQADTTTVLYAGQSLTVDDTGHLIINCSRQ
jgi:N-methylhydantoinase A